MAYHDWCICSEDPVQDGNNWFGYAGGNPISWLDPTGLAGQKEANTSNGLTFYSIEDAAIAWANKYNDDSIKIDLELSSAIYQTTDSSGKVCYKITNPIKGEKNKDGQKTVPTPIAPKDSKIVGIIHSHGAKSPVDKGKYSDDNNFSPEDKQIYEDHEVVGFLVTPSGKVLIHLPKNSEFSLSDPASYINSKGELVISSNKEIVLNRPGLT